MNIYLKAFIITAIITFLTTGLCVLSVYYPAVGFVILCLFLGCVCFGALYFMVLTELKDRSNSKDTR